MKFRVFSWIFFILSLGLTFVSLSTGFYLYQSLFTLTTAFLICTVFEILRLSSLYAIFSFKGIPKAIVSLLYGIIVTICFFVSVISFDSQIIKKNNIHIAQVERQVEEDLFKVRNEYSKKYEIDLNKLYEKRDLFQRKIAANPKSKYYNARLEQVGSEIDSIEKERKTKLDSLAFGKVSNEEIKTHLSILGIKEGGIYEQKELSEFQEALNGLFSIEVLQLQKLIGYSLAFGIESGILLLALLGFYLNKEIPKKERLHETTVKNSYIPRDPVYNKEVLEGLPTEIPDELCEPITDVQTTSHRSRKPLKKIRHIKNVPNEKEIIEMSDISEKSSNETKVEETNSEPAFVPKKPDDQIKIKIIESENDAQNNFFRDNSKKEEPNFTNMRTSFNKQKETM